MFKTKKFHSWWIIGLLIPFVGIILYYINKGMNKESRSNLLTATIIGFCVWLFVGLSFLISVNEPAPAKEYVVSEWLADTKNNETVVTVMGMTTCGYCQKYKPIIEKLSSSKGFNLYFFETDTLSQEDLDVLEKTYEFKEFEGYVPFTFIVKNGEVIAEKTGLQERDELIQFLKSNEVIN